MTVLLKLLSALPPVKRLLQENERLEKALDQTTWKEAAKELRCKAQDAEGMALKAGPGDTCDKLVIEAKAYHDSAQLIEDILPAQK